MSQSEDQSRIKINAEKDLTDLYDNVQYSLLYIVIYIIINIIV